MADKRTRRRFTASFKAQAVKRLLEGGRGLSEVATELGLSTGQLSTWRTELLAAGSAEALAARKAEEAETLRLKREVKRLEEENVILRKAGECQTSCRSQFTTTCLCGVAFLHCANLRLRLRMPRCSLRGRSGARHPRHARDAARGSGCLRSSHPLRCAPRRGIARSGRESRFADRTRKLDL